MPRSPSPLDAFFTARTPLDVLRAARATLDVSRGEIVSPATFARSYPEEGERCPRCGVEATRTSVREERWGHVELPVPLFHPVCVPAIAELLGLSVDDVRAIARCEAHLEDGAVVRDEALQVSIGDTNELASRLERATGPAADALRAEGFSPADLLVTRVPVTPPGDRPPVRMPGGHDMPDARSVAYVELVSKASLVRRLIELDAPPLVVRATTARLQEAFERVLARGDVEGAPWQPDEDREPCSTLPAAVPTSGDYWTSTPDPTRPVDAALVADRGVLVQFPHATACVDLEGNVLDVFDVEGAKLLGVDEEGARAVFVRGGEFFARDLRARAWLDHVPPSFPCVLIDEVHETAYLVDARRARLVRLVDVADYPMFWAVSPDGRHVWVEDKEGSGGVYGAESGMRELDVRTLALEDAPPVLGADGRFGDEVDDDPMPELPSHHAVVLTPDDRFRLCDGRVVAEDERVLFVLAGAPPVVAFSRGGDALVVVRRDHAAIVEVDVRATRARVSLSAAVEAVAARAPAAPEA